MGDRKRKRDGVKERNTKRVREGEKERDTEIYRERKINIIIETWRDTEWDRHNEKLTRRERDKWGIERESER